jgi:transcriptional regulator with PAS, ATPase and Fis domain
MAATVGPGRAVALRVVPTPTEYPGGSLLFPSGYVRGHSAAMRDLYAQVEELAGADLPLLLLGETGVGKEQLAHVLHASSPRRLGPFVAVNCAAIPADLLEAEMFGIGRGVATGVTERAGKFQLAHRGTLFLDEIGDMAPVLQAKLLRALQGREVQPVGGAPVAVDVRIITATNSDLDLDIEAGRFRRDLYYRVAGVALRVPPLRERREDVPDLVEALLAACARESGRPAPPLTARALQVLTAYAWPGNVRELEHELRRLTYLGTRGQAIDVPMLSERILASGPDEPPASLTLEAHLDRLERRLIQGALGRAAGKRALAARMLGISRNGLAMKMERLGLQEVTSVISWR